MKMNSSDTDILIEKIHREVIAIREKLEDIEKMIIHEEEVSDSNLEDIEKLKTEATGESVVLWKDVKKEVKKLIR